MKDERRERAKHFMEVLTDLHLNGHNVEKYPQVQKLPFCSRIRTNITLAEIAECSYGWKNPSDCGGCVAGQVFVAQIYGRDFYQLPFVKFHGDRQYSFTFKDLKIFVEKGEKAVKKAKEKERTRAARAEEAREKRAATSWLRNKLGKKKVSIGVKNFLIGRSRSSSRLNVGKIIVQNPDFVVIKTDRWFDSGSAGCGYFEGVEVYFHGQSNSAEYQWRDAYSAAKDRWDLRIDDIGKIAVSEKGQETIVTLELINRRYGNRNVSFTFKTPERTVTTEKSLPCLTSKQLTKLTSQLNKAAEEVLRQAEVLWECKPGMPLSYAGPVTIFGGIGDGYRKYDRPRIESKAVHKSAGYGLFVLVEQIDHRDIHKQLRYNLYLVKPGEKVKRIHEDHTYTNEGNSCEITVIEALPDKVKIQSGNEQIVVSVN